MEEDFIFSESHKCNGCGIASKKYKFISQEPSLTYYPTTIACKSCGQKDIIYV